MGSPQSPLDFVGRGKIYVVFVILLLAKEFEHGMYLDESPVYAQKNSNHHLVVAVLLFAHLLMCFCFIA